MINSDFKYYRHNDNFDQNWLKIVEKEMESCLCFVQVCVRMCACVCVCVRVCAWFVRGGKRGMKPIE